MSDFSNPFQDRSEIMRHADIEAKDAEIARLRAERNDEISARMKAEGEFSTMQRRIARQRRALTKLYQRRHDKNAALATARQDALAEIKQDTDELIEQGRQDGMEQAAQIALAMSISSPSVIAAAIRAAAKEGKLCDIKLQDWPEGKRLRITYRHGEDEPRLITSYAGKWHFFEPVRVEIEPHPEGFYIPARDYDRQSAEIARLRAALATARREGMEEAAKIADSRGADWAKSAIGKYINSKWDFQSRAEAGEEIAAAIRAAAKEGKP